jgi:putative methyltransferase (TIGR04325 family)
VPFMLKPLRIGLAKCTWQALDVMGKFQLGRRLIKASRETPLLSSVLEFAVCFRGTFGNLLEAQASAQPYIQQGHLHPFNNRQHRRYSEGLRESDYPVLFHLAPISSRLRSVFDLGGSIGNLFYPYATALDLSPDLVWTINDLPEKRAAALSFAKERGERRIRFTTNMADASGVDLFIATGSLQYFEDSLAQIIGRLERRPKIVVINRTPLSAQGDIVTTQVGSGYVLACKLHDVQRLVAGMTEIGYTLVARWPVHERQMLVALYPELNDTYHGLYFKLRDVNI